jgi:hypothetical protein
VYPTCISTRPIQVAIERTISIQPLLFKQTHLCCGIHLVDYGDRLDEYLGAVGAVGCEVCKSGFVGEEVVVDVSGVLGKGGLLDGLPASAHVCGVELAEMFGWRGFVVEVVGEWLIAKDILVTGWTHTHGVASESDAMESSYLLLYPCA